MSYKTIIEDNIDILVVGAGLGGTGAAYEARYWGRNKKVIIAEKANIDRSGAVAQGLYAINCYMGTRWGENNPEDHVRYARMDLMGMVREDLAFDMARHVDSAVHKFEEWGLPLMKNPETGSYMREGRWQIMIHGESYKPIVAEAAKVNADKTFNRIMVTHLLMDDAQENRVAGAVGFNVRTGNYHVFKSKTVIVGAGGASNIFKPRSVGEGAGRVWYAPWSSGSAYALLIEAGAKMTQMENRIVLARFKDGYGPVGAYFLHLKTYTQNAYGDEYESKWFPELAERVGKAYLDTENQHFSHKPIPTCLRNHAFISEVAAGRGPIHMVTVEAFQDPHLEEVGWENFLGMTVGQAVLWAATDIDPKYINPELTTSEPYVMGSHATGCGAWCSGPEDISGGIPEYFWGYNRMMTVDGLFGAGDAVGGTPHAFSSGSFTEGRLSAKAACKYIDDGKAEGINISQKQIDERKAEVYKPLETYTVGRNEIVGGTVSPSYILPMPGLQRLQKLMDEYAGGVTVQYMTNDKLLNMGLHKLKILEEDLEKVGAEDIHQLLRAWELKHRHRTSECVVQHTLFREETRWPGYYYRGDKMKLDDKNWHVLTTSQRNRTTGEYKMEKQPLYHLVGDSEK
ncbi:adenylyl-sulfate reductase subunit alpha [bacterium endosymbiont of Bathymodiolus sp. 5 South]|jgi:adenylylsulfate reductase subunit A|uniref:adenylyl-sulfate reductase subunit alpha n=1 Tax=bacterium endosymbiont of Bathymodiolus sp. 5 South TaxID=1181670 RepID=UPI0010AF9FF7|nr:adenylyl-sulfate reductase subunit alpha [bacterium endosymbiont of Bathymodiolus sp. 5 South]CAC9637537.1 Adenylylsulfate reductase alpha-subunit (EC 1.8.99.2) [uncultured Gammaproteobacteria bacterium]CAC9638607.1 Adenylylsulfate reductase alpha-subunit (EC 1.8.99.2) [uncultured Gammaproteobacteria bacterium]CAC9643026.1 Adenylylsulfate reductase alpha-subunit (EC 1.8.99.2) [uncultured Gammaproteobacteria bacterium]SHN90434.1 Adenylylsulfate reductase alpha-subunit [bacterium endosymbiont 